MLAIFNTLLVKANALFRSNKQPFVKKKAFLRM